MIRCLFWGPNHQFCVVPLRFCVEIHSYGKVRRQNKIFFPATKALLFGAQTCWDVRRCLNFTKKTIRTKGSIQDATKSCQSGALLRRLDNLSQGDQKHHRSFKTCAWSIVAAYFGSAAIIFSVFHSIIASRKSRRGVRCAGFIIVCSCVYVRASVLCWIRSLHYATHHTTTGEHVRNRENSLVRIRHALFCPDCLKYSLLKKTR